MADEVTPASLGHLKVGTGTRLDLGAGDLISLTLTLASHVSLDILVGLLDITGDVKGVAGGLRDGETVWVPRMLAHVTDMHAKKEAKKLDHLQ